MRFSSGADDAVPDDGKPKKPKQSFISIPGADKVTVARYLPFMIAAMLAFGPTRIPIIFLVLLLLPLVLRIWSTPIRNDVTDARTNGNIMFVISAVALLIAGFLLRAFIGPMGLVAALLVLTVVIAWARPAALASLLLIASVFVGANLLLVAAPAAVVLARREQGRNLGYRSRFGQWFSESASGLHGHFQTNKIESRSMGARTGVIRAVSTAGFAAVAFLFALLFQDASAGGAAPDQPDELAQPGSGSARSADVATGDESWLARFASWLSGSGGSDPEPSRMIDVPRDRPNPADPDSFPWWLVVAAVAVAAVLGLLIWLWYRRKPSDKIIDAQPSSTLQRLEAIGRAVGQPRQRSEGALTFASRLGTLTGDKRLADVGPSVSGATYLSASADPVVTDNELGSIEAAPPPSPPRPSLGERMRNLGRSVVDHRRGVAVALGGVAVLGVIAWLGLFRAGDLGDPPNNLAFADATNDPPAAWEALQSADPQDLVGWELCSAYGDELSWMKSGVSQPDGGIAADIQTFPTQSGVSTASFTVHSSQEGSTTIWGSLKHREVEFGDAGWVPLGDWDAPLVAPWTFDEVIELTNMVDAVESEFVDRNGDAFRRFESMPPAWDDSIAPFALDSYGQMFVLDVWSEGDGPVTRIRWMSASGEWAEWRYLETVDANLPTVPACHRAAPFAADDWIGREAWTPTRTVPPQIGMDDQGNLYDTWLGWTTEDIERQTIGTISEPLGTLRIGGLESITVTEWSPTTDALIEQRLEWPAGTVVTHVESDGVPVLSMLERAASGPIETWGAGERIDLYSSFIVLGNQPFHAVTEERLDQILEPMWDQVDLVTTDEDDIDGDELTLLTQSTVSEVVLGRDISGEIVAVALWDSDYEWRLIGMDGAAPPSVVEREAELQACLDGDRELELDGRCKWS